MLTTDASRVQTSRRRPRPLRPTNPTRSQRAARNYEIALRSLGEHIGRLIVGFTPGDVPASNALTEMLRKYAEAITPWATRVATSMLLEVDRASRSAWHELGEALSHQLRQDLRRAPIGGRIRELLGEQVTFIRSIPTEAAQRVHELTIKGLEDSTRAKEYAAEIMRSGEVAKSRAILIARTETSRTATALTQTRAEAAGGTAYAWETVRDSSVRASHRAMQDQAVLWKAPPTLDGMTGHAGALPNCRCWPRVLLPE